MWCLRVFCSKSVLVPEAAVREGCIVISTELVTAMPGADELPDREGQARQLFERVLSWLGQQPIRSDWAHGMGLNVQVGVAPHGWAALPSFPSCWQEGAELPMPGAWQQHIQPQGILAVRRDPAWIH